MLTGYVEAIYTGLNLLPARPVDNVSRSNANPPRIGIWRAESTVLAPSVLNCATSPTLFTRSLPM